MMAPPRASGTPRERAGAWLALICGLAGLAVSAWLVRLKFGADFLCDGSGCAGGDDGPSCAEALTSAWSDLLGFPLGIWSMGHTLTTAILALSVVLRRDELARAAPHALLGLGVLGVAISAVLGVYALTSFDRLCPFCLALYVLLTLGFVAAWLIHGTSGDGSGDRGTPVLTGVLRAATVWIIATGVPAVAYQIAARMVNCPSPPPDPPPVTLAAAVEAPRLAVMLFVDPSCAHCRREVHLLLQSLPRLRAHGAELWMYMFPRASCDERQLPAHEFVDAEGRPQTNGEARWNNACLGALAAVCAEELAPGRGLEALAALFDLQDSEVPRFTTEKIERTLEPIAETLGPRGSLRACIDGDAAAATVATHQRYLLAWVRARGGRVSVPQAFVVPIVDGLLYLDEAMPATSAGKILKLIEGPEPR